MAAVGNPYENARAESFFKTLKREEGSLKDYRTVEDARASLAQFIDDVYNTKRRHSRLGYRPPAEFETPPMAGKSKLARWSGKTALPQLPCSASSVKRRGAPADAACRSLPDRRLGA